MRDVNIPELRMASASKSVLVGVFSPRDGWEGSWFLSLVSFLQVKTTPHVSGSVNPVWESVVEFMVKDFTKVRLSHLSARAR